MTYLLSFSTSTTVFLFSIDIQFMHHLGSEQPRQTRGQAQGSKVLSGQIGSKVT